MDRTLERWVYRNLPREWPWRKAETQELKTYVDGGLDTTVLLGATQFYGVQVAVFGHRNVGTRSSKFSSSITYGTYSRWFGVLREGVPLAPEVPLLTLKDVVVKLHEAVGVPYDPPPRIDRVYRLSRSERGRQFRSVHPYPNLIANDCVEYVQVNNLVVELASDVFPLPSEPMTLCGVTVVDMKAGKGLDDLGRCFTGVQCGHRAWEYIRELWKLVDPKPFSIRRDHHGG